MFWECHVVESTIEKLLDQPSDKIELESFLNESDLIQECLNQNQRLIDYLVQPNVMKQLIGHLITVPVDGQFRNAHVASELLSGDFQRIQESLLNNEHLDLFYSFLSENDSDSFVSLNPILASYFSRIVGTLIVRKTSEILNYVKARPTFKTDFIKHLDSTSIVDLIFRFVVDSGDHRSSVIQWYQEIHLIDDLMEEFRRTDSTSVQMNLSNLFTEFLRLAFDHQLGSDNEFSAPGLSATIERLLYGKNDFQQEFNSFVSSSDDRHSSSNDLNESKLSPMVLAENILSRSNFEDFFDALIQKKNFLTHGCDCLESFLDVLSRHLPAPVCLPLNSSSDENSTGAERMEINDEDSNNKSKNVSVENLGKEPTVQIYVNLLESVSTRLPQLIEILSSSKSLSNNEPLTSHRQFIEQPLGSSRLNLIKFFSKLIQIISNDFTGDEIFKIFNSNRLFEILLELFDRHIYNNFLHTQVNALLRLLIQINSVAIKQSNEIWSRTPIDNLSENSNSFHYTNRNSFKLFHSILDGSSVNLFERLFEKYERQTSEKKNSSRIERRFESPNSGHVGQILRILRENSSIFDDYRSFLTSDSMRERWQTVLDQLAEDEKKWSAMHVHDRNNGETSRINSLGQNSSLNDSNEAQQRRQIFHSRNFGSSVAPCIDDDDDDETETLNIDDELMNSEQNTTENKIAEMKKISFEPQFPPVFDEQNLWFQANDSPSSNHDDQQKNSSKTTTNLPDLFEPQRKQQEKISSSTESTFEQLCSLRSAENPSGSILYPFQSTSNNRDEALTENDEFWEKQNIEFDTKKSNYKIEDLNSNENLFKNKNKLELFENLSDTEHFNERQIERQRSEEFDVQTAISEMIQIDENDVEPDLENNFSFLIAKNLMKPNKS